MTPLLESTLASVIAQLETGVAPWRKPWAGGKCPSMPLRSTGESFSGMNAVMLSTLAGLNGFDSPYWLTFNQALDLGAHVRKGEKAAPAILYKTRVVDGTEVGSADDKVLRFLKSYAVFNASQIDGLPEQYFPSAQEVDAPLHGDIATIMARFPVPVAHGGDRACYHILSDQISMPRREGFESDQDYIATLLHEYGHATGAKHRLDRFGPDEGREDYAREELVAELTSHLTSMALNINPTESVFANHVSYLAGWASVLKDRPTELLKAAGKAQAAADFILQYRQPASDEGEAQLNEAA